MISTYPLQLLACLASVEETTRHRSGSAVETRFHLKNCIVVTFLRLRVFGCQGGSGTVRAQAGEISFVGEYCQSCG